MMALAFGRYAENLCIDDLAATTGFRFAYPSGAHWPPDISCRLSTSAGSVPLVDDRVVSHPVLAALRFGAVFVLPVVASVVAAGWLFSSARPGRRSTAAT